MAVCENCSLPQGIYGVRPGTHILNFGDEREGQLSQTTPSALTSSARESLSPLGGPRGQNLAMARKARVEFAGAVHQDSQTNLVSLPPVKKHKSTRAC